MSIRSRWGLLAVILLVSCGVVFLLLRIGESNRRKWAEFQSQTERQCWLDQIDRVVDGKSDEIVVAYGPRGVDGKLHDLDRLVGLKRLTLEDSDISKNGVASIAAIPNLEDLRLLGGDTCFNNSFFEPLRGKTSLKRLELVYKTSHHVPLSVLATLPNLKRLTVFDRKSIKRSSLTEDSWHWLGEMRQLEVLEIGGDAVTDNCISRLHEALPHVVIRRLEEEPSMR